MRELILLIAAVSFSGCRPLAVTPTPDGGSGRPPPTLPGPGVYVLQRVKGMGLPADLKPAGRYSVFERVLGGRLYLTPEHEYDMTVCGDIVDSVGRVVNPSFGGGEGKYWATGNQIYFSDPVTDGPVDSVAVRVRPDTVEVVGDLFVRDRASELPQHLPVVSVVCRAVRAQHDVRTPN